MRLILIVNERSEETHISCVFFHISKRSRSFARLILIFRGTQKIPCDPVSSIKKVNFKKFYRDYACGNEKLSNQKIDAFQVNI